MIVDNEIHDFNYANIFANIPEIRVAMEILSGCVTNLGVGEHCGMQYRPASQSDRSKLMMSQTCTEQQISKFPS